LFRHTGYGVCVSSNLYERRDITEEIMLSDIGKAYMREHPNAAFALERVVEAFGSAAEFNRDRRLHPEKYPEWLRLAAPQSQP
jgi:hypothetical protein